ncbi:hypothetical protein SERLADRAFT_345173, partial [Serpula lacrymans var. lacrymans S7.9]
TSALLDSDANSVFIDQVWAEQNGLPLVKLDMSIPVYNIDGTLNMGGCIMHKCSFIVKYQGHRERVTAKATQLGKINLILGWTCYLNTNLRLTGRQGLSHCHIALRSVMTWVS